MLTSNTPPWGGESHFLGSNHSQIYPHMRAKSGRGPMVVSKKWGCTDRQTHEGTLQVYIVVDDAVVLKWFTFYH